LSDQHWHVSGSNCLRVLDCHTACGIEQYQSRQVGACGSVGLWRDGAGFAIAGGSFKPRCRPQQSPQKRGHLKGAIFDVLPVFSAAERSPPHRDRFIDRPIQGAPFGLGAPPFGLKASDQGQAHDGLRSMAAALLVQPRKLGGCNPGAPRIGVPDLHGVRCLPVQIRQPALAWKSG
jgi:hypothetical protein